MEQLWAWLHPQNAEGMVLGTVSAGFHRENEGFHLWEDWLCLIFRQTYQLNIPEAAKILHNAHESVAREAPRDNEKRQLSIPYCTSLNS